MKCLVLDYGGSAIKYCVMDDQSNMEHNGEVTAPLQSLEQFVETTGQIYDQFCDQVEGIAISFPGTLDIETGTLYAGGAYLHLLEGKSIFEVLKDRCPLPMTIENDGKAAALAEAWKGNLKDCRDGAAIVLGTGIGGGLIKDGKIHRGKHFGGGEFSSVITDGGNNIISRAATYTCSTEGIVERATVMKGAKKAHMFYIPMMEKFDPDSVQALRDRADGPKYPDLEMNGFELFRLLEEGDPDIKMLYDEFIASNVRLIINVANIFDPDRIVVGGGISKEPRLIADLQEAVKNVFNYGLSVVTGIDIQPCYYRSSANLYGAMYNYLQQRAPELITH